MNPSLGRRERSGREKLREGASRIGRKNSGEIDQTLFQQLIKPRLSKSPKLPLDTARCIAITIFFLNCPLWIAKISIIIYQDRG